MSVLTARLMGRPHTTRSKWVSKLQVVEDRLFNEYGCPSLGNFRDAKDEIFYIMLSARTTEALYLRAFNRLFKTFPDLESLASASIRKITKEIGGAGLGEKRSKQVKSLAKKLLTDFGEDCDTSLRSMSPEDSFNYLTNLPGMGPKSALCVMMYSLDIDVFPVDVNVQRIAERLGVIRKGLKHYQAQQILPKYVPAGKSKELHIGMVVHGRKVCTPKSPKCTECVILDLCRFGLKAIKDNEGNSELS